MEKNKILLVSTKILPPIYSDVLKVKKLLADGVAPNASKAVKMVGISRSAFYKYKNYVFEYDDKNYNTLNLSAVLTDKAGIFSAFTNVLSELGANILTANQTSPVDGTASVTLTVRTDNLKVTEENLLAQLKAVPGIISVKLQ